MWNHTTVRVCNVTRPDIKNNQCHLHSLMTNDLLQTLVWPTISCLDASDLFYFTPINPNDK